MSRTIISWDPMKESISAQYSALDSCDFGYENHSYYFRLEAKYHRCSWQLVQNLWVPVCTIKLASNSDLLLSLGNLK